MFSQEVEKGETCEPANNLYAREEAVETGRARPSLGEDQMTATKEVIRLNINRSRKV